MDRDRLAERLDRFPRLELASYPTPLERLDGLSRELGRQVYLKRDDGIGPGMGGNKTRNLEYLLARAQRSGLAKVATYGGLQSNHTRITAAAARRSGLEPHLFYFAHRPATLSGNLLLSRLAGGELHFMPLQAGGDASMTLELTDRLVHLVTALRLGRHTFIPAGGHSWLGSLGYVRAALELDAQARTMDLPPGWVVTAAGTGGTLAGLWAGLELIGSPLRVLGIDIGRLWKRFPASIARVARQICVQLSAEGRTARQAGSCRKRFRADQVPLVQSIYAGDGYAQDSPAGWAAIRKLARLDGIPLDPVYTGKSFAGLLDLLQHGRFGQNQPVIFLHTGGGPALLAGSPPANTDSGTR